MYRHVLTVSFPELSSHLAAIAEVVVFPDFENAIVKIQRGNEAHLKNHERRAVLQFLKNASGQAVSKNEERKEEPGLSFIEGCAIKKQRLQSSSKYINTLIVAPVSDIYEQVFSRAKYIMIREVIFLSGFEYLISTVLWGSHLLSLSQIYHFQERVYSEEYTEVVQRVVNLKY